jgi:hypothetical protein
MTIGVVSAAPARSPLGADAVLARVQHCLLDLAAVDGLERSGRRRPRPRLSSARDATVIARTRRITRAQNTFAASSFPSACRDRRRRVTSQHLAAVPMRLGRRPRALVSPWSTPPWRRTITWTMPPPTNPILLCEYRDRSGSNRLSATLDEVTLTYSVVLRDGSGATRPLRRYLPALHVARCWAVAYRDAVMRS